jgi:hypothetical protein
MINISSAMGAQFAWSAAEMTAEILRLGPNPLGENGTTYLPTMVDEIASPDADGEHGGSK